MTPESAGHVPVLVAELLDHVRIGSGQLVVDATVGLGGHSLRVLEELGPTGRLVGLERDEASLACARERLAPFAGRFSLYHERFSRLRKVLDQEGVAGADVVVADLGVNSAQLDDAERGFSFQEDGPLDMRMDRSQKLTAEDLVNALSERELADLLYYRSQERLSRRIAKRICQVRHNGRIRTTGQLARVVCDAVGVRDPESRRSKTHPATRTFQALRMAVNEEEEELAALLDQAPGCLVTGGRFAVICFHSTEDGAVKRDFLRRKREGSYQILTKKPITASSEECARNPRSRSAKLRVAQRTALAVSDGPAAAEPEG